MKRPMAQITSLQLPTNTWLQSEVHGFRRLVLLPGDHWGLAPAWRQKDRARQALLSEEAIKAGPLQPPLQPEAG